ncbi:hypothetical protein J2I47_08200 [Fibrella sp. HMF5335]|uniref:Copper-binding protein MbnP-like domain-containing protein n=1 Tax=Fibrella rubiginis TaxID=2817060 RepID=A0A939K5J0_9BACT|nr:MbnP family protein [Fibrella rubiginis]MBO0936520.1 hypothetical protein [Fibrella rubiginis]
MRRLYFVILLLVLLAACKSTTVDQQVGAVNMSFVHQVNGSPLTLNTTTYTNKSGEAFTISKFDYFISNIRLIRADGSAYTVPQDDSYFLIRSNDPTSQTFTLTGVPAGDYAQIEYMVGVDSLRNTADISRRKGVLDPGSSHTSGMYWDWNTGYIHLKLEGTSPAAPVDATGARNFRYHIGLFGGYQSKTINNLRTVRVPLGISTGTSRLSVGPNLRTTLQIIADAGKLFDGPTPFKIADYPDVMVSPFSGNVANNYATMFSFGFSSAVSQ